MQFDLLWFDLEDDTDTQKGDARFPLRGPENVSVVPCIRTGMPLLLNYAYRCELFAQYNAKFCISSLSADIVTYARLLCL